MPKPSKPKKNQKSGRFSKTSPGFFWFIVLTLVGLYFASQFSENLQSQVVIYSELKEKIKAGEISKVILTPDTVEGLTKSEPQKRFVALRVEDSDLVPLLETKLVAYEGRSTGGGLQDFLFTWVLPLILMFFLWQFLLGRAFKQGPPGLMTFGKSKARLVTQKKEKTTFADVAGAEEAKEELREVIDFLKTPQKFLDIGGRIPKGVLLVGPPGTGKTLLARAVAGESGVSFMQLSGSDFVEMFVGVGAARVRDLFSEAQKNAPCIVFIDELDAIAKSRGFGGMQSNDEREQTLNQILVEMDGFDNHAGVIIMAATNRPEVLDPAILRPGRFDRHIVVNKPDIKEREAILKVHVLKVKLAEDVNLATVASRTPGFSGADLANVVNEAALLAVRKNLKTVNGSCFEDAIDRVIAGLAKKNRVINEPEKRIIAVHESGHALVANKTAGADKVHRISIVPRSSGALGFTLQIPEEDRHLMTAGQLRSMIRVLLGGRAAESLVFGEVTSGAQDDLRRATTIAKRMISEFGMGKSVGLVSLMPGSTGFLENPFGRDESLPVSEELANKIDKEVRGILDEEFENAQKILTQYRAVLDRITNDLLKKETLEANDFLALVDEPASI